MSNVLIGIIGVILFIGLAVAGAVFLGDRFTESKNDSEAARYIAEGAQISQAYELYGIQEGNYPDAPGSDGKMEQMKSAGYLKATPLGGRQTTGYATAWYIDEEKGAALTYIGSDKASEQICIRAREKAGIPNAEQVKRCDASDITNSDPCCIGV